MGYFFPFYPPNSPKNQHFTKWKKCQILLSVPKIMIICYTVPEMRHVVNVIVIFHFELFFFPFTPLITRKMKISKKWKKHLDISSFYTSRVRISASHFTICEAFFKFEWNWELYFKFFNENAKLKKNIFISLFFSIKHFPQTSYLLKLINT